MSIQFCISPDQIRGALEEIEAAEKNGFHFCLAVFEIAQAGQMLDQCLARYSDLVERAHPTDPEYHYGRFQCVSRTHRFENGKLIPLGTLTSTNDRRT